MDKTVRAVYENGALRPLEPLDLVDRQEVTLTIDENAPEFLLVAPDEWADAASDDVSLAEVRRALSTIRTSLSRTVMDERQER